MVGLVVDRLGSFGALAEIVDSFDDRLSTLGERLEKNLEALDGDEG